MLAEINTILYATDLQSESDPALSMAMSLAEKYQAKVVFLNVIEPINPNVYAWGGIESWDEIEKEALNRSLSTSKQRLDDFFSQELPSDTSIDRPSVKVINGYVTQTILDCADEIDADLIVMGSNGHGVISELLIGSVADKVVRLSKRPVLLTPIAEE